MITYPWLLAALALINPLTAMPTGEQLVKKQANSTCNQPLVRKEWRTLSTEDKKSYIDAVKCLYNKPAVNSKDILPGVTNRYEDFVGDHILQASANHFVGHFYPWHRLLVWAYERELRLCGYEGAQPYWDWSLDAASYDDMLKSPVFDPDTGFGGNGEWVPGTPENPEPGIPLTGGTLVFNMSDRTGGGCIPNGPFANLTLHMGPQNSVAYNEWCVRRDFTPNQFMSLGNSASVAEGMAQSDYGFFSKLTEDTIHGAGHQGVGGMYGVLSDIWASRESDPFEHQSELVRLQLTAGDPLFWLHHCNIDRSWWSWQSRNLTERLHDISGPITPFDHDNRLGGNVTLDFEVRTNSTINVNLPIRDLMDIGNGFLCYTYDSLY
ncbi:hypothetical protein K4K59_009686 [Colletotrichum sp. SAR11_240]|nr:hypothetical protein K4K59_009686 [Colletotrichum sp. SAR11_240]